MLSIYPTKRFENNIFKTYERATAEDTLSGRQWYSEARDTATRIARGDTIKGAGVIAALSPQLTWEYNVELAGSCIALNTFYGHYGQLCRKARRISNGEEPLTVLGGDKTRAFYTCIIAAGVTEEVCVDRHALAVILGRNATEQERCAIKGKRYRTYAQAYRNVARQISLSPAQLQAITWVTWRREKKLD